MRKRNPTPSPKTAPLLYQQPQGRLVGLISSGLEQEGAAEIKALGATQIQTATRTVTFRADPAALQRINYCSRLFTRILAPLTSFPCPDAQQFYRAAVQFDWRRFLSTRNSLAIFASIVESPAFNNSHYAALLLKDAIVDHFKQRFDQRPRVDTQQPDVWFNLRVEKQQAVISLDTSGGSLHRRGYRCKQVPAPLQETLAAAIVRLSQWDVDRPLVDPMCGGGTLLCEALMHATGTPAQFKRRIFGFFRLPEYDHSRWKKLRAEIDRNSRLMPPGRLAGNDIAVSAIAATNANLRPLPQSGMVKLQVGDFSKLRLRPDTTILCNPPYGIRLGDADQSSRLVRRLGQWLRRQPSGCRALVYFGQPQQMEMMECQPIRTYALQNGGLDGRLALYELNRCS